MFNIDKNKIKIIPNGVDAEISNGNSSIFYNKYGLYDFILFIGRIEPRKNVYRLIEAFNSLELKTHLVIIGKKTDIDYYNKCQSISSNKIIYIPSFSHDDEMLRSAYKAAKVVVLPSFLETPGLVALEGGAAGANIVITKIGGTKDYFGDMAWYIDPTSTTNIAIALKKAYESEKTSTLSNHILSNFTWDIVAEKTKKIYDDLFI